MWGEIGIIGTLLACYLIRKLPLFFVIFLFVTGFTIGLLATILGVLIGVLFSYYIEEVRVLITTIFIKLQEFSYFKILRINILLIPKTG